MNPKLYTCSKKANFVAILILISVFSIPFANAASPFETNNQAEGIIVDSHSIDSSNEFHFSQNEFLMNSIVSSKKSIKTSTTPDDSGITSSDNLNKQDEDITFDHELTQGVESKNKLIQNSEKLGQHEEEPDINNNDLSIPDELYNKLSDSSDLTELEFYEFLRNDQTNTKEYSWFYMCSSFVKDLTINARQHNITLGGAILGVTESFGGDTNHAVNYIFINHKMYLVDPQTDYYKPLLEFSDKYRYIKFYADGEKTPLLLWNLKPDLDLNELK